MIPDFIEAQEAVSSGAERMRKLREKRAAEGEAAPGEGEPTANPARPGRFPVGSRAGKCREPSRNPGGWR